MDKRYKFSEDYYEKTGQDPELLITNVSEPWIECYKKAIKEFDDIEMIDIAYNAVGDILPNHKAVLFKDHFDMDRLQEFWKVVHEYKPKIKTEMMYKPQDQTESKRYQCIKFKGKLILSTITKDSIDKYKNIISDIPELYIEDIGYFIVDKMLVTSTDHAAIVFKDNPDSLTKQKVINKYFSKLQHI